MITQQPERHPALLTALIITASRLGSRSLRRPPEHLIRQPNPGLRKPQSPHTTANPISSRK
jgi:hypothetical protein